MTCANETSVSATRIPLQIPAPRSGLTFRRATTAMIEAFREALEMRRAARKKYLLDDE